jgi:HlyD family secretion protein
MKNNRAGFKLVTVALTLAVIGGLAWYAVARSGWLSAEQEEQIKGAAVQRGSLRISVVERGNLKAADAVVLKSEIEGNATILYLIPEGTLVKEGDLVCELDATSQLDRRVAQEITLRNAEAAFVKAKQNYEIQKSQNDSDIERAKQSLSFAQIDLNRFIDPDGDRTAKKAQADEKIKLAEEEHTRANEKLIWSQKLYEKGFLTTTELESDRLSQSRAGIQLEQARRDRDLLQRFQLPRDEADLIAKLEEARRELDRVNLQAAARLVDFDADMRTREAQFNLEKEKLQKLENQIAKAKMFAPRAGMVVYAQQDSGRMGGSQPIQEGTSVRERQDIVTIPNAAGMVAQVSLHESVLKQVSVGQSCLMKVDALGPREFHGRVSFVAVLPDQNSWWANPNTRLYRTEVQILDGNPEMRPGMSCAIEILVDDIADATYVPVQAVFRSGGDNLAFVVKPGAKFEERKIQVGRYNANWVEITEGLKVGDTVMLSAPAGFTPQPAPQVATPALPGAAPAAGADAPVVPAAPVGSAPPGAGANPNAAAAQLPGGAPAGAARGEGGGERGDRGSRGERGSGAPASDEERERMRQQFRERMANMTEEERAKAMEQMRQRGGGPGGGGTGGDSNGGGGQKSDG